MFGLYAIRRMLHRLTHPRERDGVATPSRRAARRRRERSRRARALREEQARADSDGGKENGPHPD